MIQARRRVTRFTRGNPTVEVDVILPVRRGGSRGSSFRREHGLEHEVIELRDGDKKRFGGKGVSNAVSNVTEKILPRLQGVDALGPAYG